MNALNRQTPRAWMPASSWPRRVAILSDYVRLPYANGATFATQFLYRELTRRGHEVTIIGPRDPAAKPEDLPERHICLPSVPLQNHPGVYIPLPLEGVLRQARDWDFDVVLGQTATELMELGLWLRATKGIPLLAVNTVHLPSVYPVVMPESLHHVPAAHWAFQNTFLRLAEGTSSSVYNACDGLIVLSQGLEKYWRTRGVESPIHVIPRCVEPRIFDAAPGADPFPKHFKKGARMLVVCRHTREKGVERLLEIFAKWVVPASPDATLTLIGDGPDHDLFQRKAKELGVFERTHFPGEFPVTALPTWYHHADVFTYTSLSETYGQVVSEALWSALPVVAFADDMGVSHQVEHERTGLLVAPGPDEAMADWRFGRAVVSLLQNPARRHQLSSQAAARAHDRSSPQRMLERFLAAFESAREHAHNHYVAPAAWQKPLHAMKHGGRWMAINGIVYGLGKVREPAVVNRHGRRQPAWRDLPEVEAPAKAVETTAKVVEATAEPTAKGAHTADAPHVRAL